MISPSTKKMKRTGTLFDFAFAAKKTKTSDNAAEREENVEEDASRPGPSRSRSRSPSPVRRVPVAVSAPSTKDKKPMHFQVKWIKTWPWLHNSDDGMHCALWLIFTENTSKMVQMTKFTNYCVLITSPGST